MDTTQQKADIFTKGLSPESFENVSKVKSSNERTSRPRDVTSCEFFVAVLFCHDARTLVSARSENNSILRLLHDCIYSYNLVEPNCVKSFYFRSTYVG